jgi:hypothetical protein
MPLCTSRRPASNCGLTSATTRPPLPERVVRPPGEDRLNDILRQQRQT